MNLPAEFAMIARHFRPLAGPDALGLSDDAAVVVPPAGRALVVTVDTMVAGVHFPPDDPPRDIGRKLLRVNLSDIASMGAEPLFYLLALSMPRGTTEEWLADFVSGLAADQQEFGVSLAGGDTTSTPGPISLTVTMAGHVAPGQAWLRSGARAGDDLFVTGRLGGGILGLMALRGEVEDPDGSLVGRYRLPQPRLGLKLHGLISACMDLSDGLVQDVGHICRASGVGARIEAEKVPLVPAGYREERLALCLTGGDEYELIMAVPPENRDAVVDACHARGVEATRIGRFEPGEADVVVIGGDGRAMIFDCPGWSHF